MKSQAVVSWSWAGSLVLGCLLGSGCVPAKKTEWKTMNLVQEKPILVEGLDGDNVHEHGDVMVFEANLKDQNGLKVAQLLGQHTVIDLPGNDGIGDPSMEERFVNLAFVFTNGSKVFVQGASVYPEGQTSIKENIPQFRAIVGGTEAFRGIRGQVKTTRNSDETYLHVLEYTLD